MSKILIDLICCNKECRKIYLNNFYNEESIDSVRRGMIVCDICLESLIVYLKDSDDEP